MMHNLGNIRSIQKCAQKAGSYVLKDIQCFDVECWIHLTSVTWFLIFPRVQSTSENSEKSCLSSEIKSIFNFNNTEFSVYYVFQVNMFLSNLRHCMQYITWHHNHIIFTLKKHLILSQCEKTAWENSTSIGWNLLFYGWKCNN